MDMPRLLKDSRFLELLFCLFRFDAAACLNLAQELIASSIKNAEIIVSEFPPHLSDFTFELLPVPCESIPAHVLLLFSQRSLRDCPKNPD